MQLAFEEVPREFVSKTEIYDHKTPITEAISKIGKFDAVVVMKDNEYYGIVDNRTMARKGSVLLSNKSSISKFSHKVPLIDKSTSIDQAIAYFDDSGAKARPYTEGRKVVGIVKRDAMLRALLSMHMLSKYLVNEVMTSPIISVEEDTTIAHARAEMQNRRISRLVVLSGGKLYGILTYKDMLQYSAKSAERKEKLERHISMSAKVGEIAQRNVVTADYKDNLEGAIRDMVESDISSILVTRSGKPAGLLTVRDVFEAAVKHIGQGKEEHNHLGS